MQFHSKGFLIQGFDRKNVEEIQEHKQKIDFLHLLSLIKDVNEVNDLEVVDLLDVDAALIGELEEKCLDFIGAAADIASQKASSTEEDQENEAFMMYLTTLRTEMNQNNINLQILLDNLDKVKHLQYSKNGVQVYFE